jgi:hypothetical protein
MSYSAEILHEFVTSFKDALTKEDLGDGRSESGITDERIQAAQANTDLVDRLAIRAGILHIFNKALYLHADGQGSYDAIMQVVNDDLDDLLDGYL